MPNNGSNAISKGKLNSNFWTEKNKKTKQKKTGERGLKKLIMFQKNYEKKPYASYILAKFMNNQWHPCPYTK